MEGEIELAKGNESNAKSKEKIAKNQYEFYNSNVFDVNGKNEIAVGNIGFCQFLNRI